MKHRLFCFCYFNLTCRNVYKYVAVTVTLLHVIVMQLAQLLTKMNTHFFFKLFISTCIHDGSLSLVKQHTFLFSNVSGVIDLFKFKQSESIFFSVIIELVYVNVHVSILSLTA